MDIEREKGIWNGSWPLRELDNPHINHYLSCVIEREREEIVVEAEREREREGGCSKEEDTTEAEKEDLESHGNELFLWSRGSHSNGRSYKYIQGVSLISSTRCVLSDSKLII